VDAGTVVGVGVAEDETVTGAVTRRAGIGDRRIHPTLVPLHALIEVFVFSWGE